MTGPSAFHQRVVRWPRTRTHLLCSLVCATVVLQPLPGSAQRPSRIKMVTVSITPGHPANRFIPSHALGAGIDGHDKGDADRQLKPKNIEAMLSAGLKSLTYRLRTELANDVWHWNPQGVWSDPARKEGYWISDSKSDTPIEVSFGYRLPRRGNTIDQGNDDGYSRLDDGDRGSFWKSNPYLDRSFTREDNSLHPQWIVIEFNEPKLINAARLLWGKPFAMSYRVQYANFDDISDIALNPPGLWRDFPSGVVNIRTVVDLLKQPDDSDAILRLSAKPIKTRSIRILMTRSSGSLSEEGMDTRGRLGFAMREVYLGQVDNSGKFHDEIHHGADRNSQTVMYVSSTDPWHRAGDLDEGVEQPGFDRVFHSGLTNNLPVLLATGLLLNTPENAANEIHYLKSRGYSFDRVELGEEPDGQYTTPEDFGALYLQWADAIHAVDPNVKLGGPSFQEIQPGDEPPAQRRGNSAWMKRFLNYLRERGRLRDFAFFSFEWYPFDDVCEPVAPQLLRAPNMLTTALSEMERRGLPRSIPWIISEYGYSAFTTRAEISIEGALLNADIVGRFLTLGGDQAFLFGYTPSQSHRDQACTAGNNMLFLMDNNGEILHRFATYFGARLLTQEWTKPGDEWHEVYPATADVTNGKGEAIVTAYAVYRPDRLWSLLVINKDPRNSYQVKVRFLAESRGAASAFAGPVDLYQFSGSQYELNDDKNNPYPTKADPPTHRVVPGNRSSLFELPAYSLTVLRGAGQDGTAFDNANSRLFKRKSRRGHRKVREGRLCRLCGRTL